MKMVDKGKKRIKRDLIGFVAGEKGSIGKAQALALGAGTLAVAAMELQEAEGTFIWEDCAWADWEANWHDWCHHAWTHHAWGHHAWGHSAGE